MIFGIEFGVSFFTQDSYFIFYLYPFYIKTVCGKPIPTPSLENGRELVSI